MNASVRTQLAFSVITVDRTRGKCMSCTLMVLSISKGCKVLPGGNQQGSIKTDTRGGRR